MADLSITITVPDEQLPALLAAFARRFKNPDLTVEQMLAGLKVSAIGQMNDVVVAEQRAALDEQKSAITPLDLA